MFVAGTKITFKKDIIFNGITIPKGVYYIDESNQDHIAIINDNNEAFLFKFVSSFLSIFGEEYYNIEFDKENLSALNNIRENRIKNNIEIKVTRLE